MNDHLPYVIAAVSALAGAVAILYEWARQNFIACKRREEECQDKFNRVLMHLAGIEKISPQAVNDAIMKSDRG